MCGIVALYGFDDSEKILEKISVLQKHRGPDNQGFWGNGNVHFSHQRLSIIDLDSRSNQPLIKNKKAIIFNGEIYNFKELKKTLAYSPLTQASLKFSNLISLGGPSGLPPNSI